jgi:hypothetical protein
VADDVPNDLEPLEPLTPADQAQSDWRARQQKAEQNLAADPGQHPFSMIPQAIKDQLATEAKAIPAAIQHPIQAADVAIAEPLKEIGGGVAGLVGRTAGNVLPGSLGRDVRTGGEFLRQVGQEPLIPTPDIPKDSIALSLPGQITAAAAAPEVVAASQLGQNPTTTLGDVQNAALSELMGRGAQAVGDRLQGAEPIPNDLEPVKSALPQKPTPEQHQQIRDAIANHPIVKGLQAENAQIKDLLAKQPEPAPPRPPVKLNNEPPDAFAAVEAQRAARPRLPRTPNEKQPIPNFTPEQLAAMGKNDILNKPPAFTEGANGPTAPGEIGTRNATMAERPTASAPAKTAPAEIPSDLTPVALPPTHALAGENAENPRQGSDEKLPEGIEDAAANQNPETVTKGLNAAPESVLEKMRMIREANLQHEGETTEAKASKAFENEQAGEDKADEYRDKAESVLEKMRMIREADLQHEGETTEAKASKAFENEQAGEDKADEYLERASQDAMGKTPNWKEIEQDNAGIPEAKGSNRGTNEEIRRTIGSAEFAAHRQAGEIEPFHKVAEKFLDTPQKRQAWVDAVEKTGKSPIPELQGLADANRKFNEEEIAARKASGEKETDKLNPNHISFLAKKTNRYVGGVKDLQGPEGFRYQRESENRADFERKINDSAGGLELLTPNIAKEIQAGHADVAKSLAFRQSLKDRKADGGLIHVPEGGTLPEGWRLAPDMMSNDPLINTQKGTKLALPAADAMALENFQNSGKTGRLGKTASGLANGLHYMFDLVTPARGLNAEIGNLIENSARGNIGDLNPVKNWKSGYDLLTKPITALQENPITKPLADGLQYISEKGGFRFEGRGPEKSGFGNKLRDIEKTYNPLSYLKQVADPFKVSTAAKMGQYALEKVNSGEWTPEEGRNFATAQRKIIDSLFGHGKNIDTKNPEVLAWTRLVNPLHEWTTGAIKQLGRGAAETIAAKGNINKTSVPKLLSNVTAALGTTALAGMALSKFYTGTMKVPTSIADIGKTGRNNPDGSEERVMTASMFLPATEAIGMAIKGDPSGAAQKLLVSNPFLKPLVESMAGYDFQGNRIEGFMNKAEHVLAGTMPLIGRNADQSVNPTSFLGIRNSPEELEDTPFQRQAKEDLKQIHTSQTPEEQAEEQQKYQWEDSLANGGMDKNLDKTMEQMLAAGYNDDQINQIISDSQKPKGVTAYARELHPDQLSHIWDVASPEERDQMLPIILDRLDKRTDKNESPSIQQGWADLLNKI